MQTVLAVAQIVVAVAQVLTLAALVVTAVEAVRQFKSATEQAHASEIQAKASEMMARLSLQQTELMRAQLHAAFRPLVEIVGGEHGNQSAMLTVKNVGTSPALALHAVFRNGWKRTWAVSHPKLRENSVFITATICRLLRP